MFFIFAQNNSKGKYLGPAMNLIISADGACEANRIAQQYGVYFSDSPLARRDCVDCCGYRWRPVSQVDGVESLLEALCWIGATDSDAADFIQRAADDEMPWLEVVGSW